ncbi:MAG: RNA polymerase sigma-70 factor [Bacteroidota bacterium]
MKTRQKPEEFKTKDGFQQIYSTYFSKVLALCMKYTGDESLSKDLVQDVFVSLWEKRKSLVIEKSLERYLCWSVKMKVFEHSRNQSIKRKNLEIVKSRQTEIVLTDENDFGSVQLHHEIRTVANNLSEKCRRIFLMSRQDGLSNKQIAFELNISERTVQYHIKNALRDLKQGLKYRF